jgi:hypothetical protein
MAALRAALPSLSPTVNEAGVSDNTPELGGPGSQGDGRGGHRSADRAGAMDEFCVFSRALDAREIRALYRQGKPQGDTVAVPFDAF